MMSDDDALRRVLKPVVRGQLRSFVNDHPNALGKEWLYSIERRILNDLLSREMRLRLRTALCGPVVAESCHK